MLKGGRRTRQTEWHHLIFILLLLLLSTLLQSFNFFIKRNIYFGTKLKSKRNIYFDTEEYDFY